MKQNAIYIIPPYSLSQRSDVDNFEQFSDKDFLFLKSTIYLNLLENVNVKNDKTDIFLIFDVSDKEYITNEFINLPQKLFVNSIKDLNSLFVEFSSKEFISYKNNLIIFSDVIDIRPTDIDKFFNLLNIDDKSLVISKSSEDKIRIFGFNHYSDELLKYLIDSNLSLDKFLTYNKSCAYFVNTLNDVMTVNNLNDFKILYSELSLKKSNEYCSHRMHERFTHLFIEYKDLLK